MKLSEIFALNQHLSDWNIEKTYPEILESILNENEENFVMWFVYEDYEPASLVELIQDTQIVATRLIVNSGGKDKDV